MRAAIVAMLLAACGSGRAVPPDPEVIIDLAAGVKSVRTSVEAGTVVRWRSMDGLAHTITSASLPEAFNDVVVPAGGVSEPVVLAAPGAYPYFCSTDVREGQSGTLVITPAPIVIMGDD